MSGNRVHLPVAEAYDRWSGLYDAYDNPMVFAAARAVDRLATEAAGHAVLEFGCGTGRNLERMKRAGATRVAGLDLSEGMLAQARARDAGLELLRQDMAAPVALPDAAFGLVLFCLTLEHVAEMAAPLAEARRLLAPGGQVAVIEIHPYLSLAGLAAHFVDGGETVEMPTVAHGFGDYVRAAAGAGLRLAACTEWRPRDLGDDTPPKLLKRGPDMPMVLELRLTAASA